jgi:hypothetical protein
MACKWQEAWVGPCKESEDESGFCKKHKGLKCCSCGAQATHNCEETGQFVCGEFLCGECEHTTFENGTNGGIGFNAQEPPEGMRRHTKKVDQIYSPWYSRRPFR